MKRLLLVLALGLVLGALLSGGTRPVSDTPWPAPTATPILSVVDQAGLARAECDARVVEAAFTGWAAQRSTPCECGGGR